LYNFIKGEADEKSFSQENVIYSHPPPSKERGIKGVR
jgi:hypothetical protein